MNELFEKAKQLIEESSGTCIARNSRLIDSDTLTWVVDDTIYIEFEQDEYEDIKINIDNIRDIKFDVIGAMTVIVLYLKRLKPILIHCLPY